jgi:hypothetical protein
MDPQVEKMASLVTRWIMAVLACIAYFTLAFPLVALWLASGYVLGLAVPSAKRTVEGVFIVAALGYAVLFALGNRLPLARRLARGLGGGLAFGVLALFIFALDSLGVLGVFRVSSVPVPVSVAFGLAFGIILALINAGWEYQRDTKHLPVGCTVLLVAPLLAALAYGMEWLVLSPFFKSLDLATWPTIVGVSGACALLIGIAWRRSKGGKQKGHESETVSSSDESGTILNGNGAAKPE